MDLALHHHGPDSSDSAPPVLWVHGYTMDSTLWGPSWEGLPGWHHVGVDLPGHGASGPLAVGTTRAEVGAALAEVAERLGAARIVALSFGTLFAVELAVARPDLLSHVVLAAPTYAGAGHAEGTAARYRELAGLRQWLGAGHHLTERWMTSPPDIFTGTLDHPALRASIAEVVDRHGWDELVDGSIHGLTVGEHTPEDLAAIRARLLVIVGEADMPTFRTNASVLGHAVPSGEVVVVPDAGHLPLLEVPERLAGLLQEHLTREPAGSSVR